jgi:hypothetical protein
LQSPDEVAIHYGVSLAQVHAALAYYYEHQAELEADIQQQIATAKALKEEHLKHGGHSILP